MRLLDLFEDTPAPDQIAWFNADTRKYISLGEVPHSQYALENAEQFGLQNNRTFRKFMKLHKEEIEAGDPGLFDANEEFLNFMFRKGWVRIIHRRDFSGAPGLVGEESSIHSNNLRNIVKAARFINKSSPIKKLYVQDSPWDDSTILSGKKLAMFLKHGRIPTSRVAELMEDRQKGKSLPEAGYEYRYVTIYRAVVATVNNFAPMDYVTMSQKFAIEHAEHLAVTEEETAHVLKAMVKAADVYEAYNPGEYFYDGASVNKVRIIHVAKGWGDES